LPDFSSFQGQGTRWMKDWDVLLIDKIDRSNALRYTRKFPLAESVPRPIFTQSALWIFFVNELVILWQDF
jgi:hypothetical protein